MKAAMLVLVLIGAALTGCGIQPKAGGTRASGAPSPGSADATAAVFAPERIHVHPLTRITRQEGTGRTVVEAHVELLDRWGDNTKWLGTMVLELYRTSAAGGGAPEQINVWNLDLTDPEVNAQAYDRVTRTYRATLTGVAGDPGRGRGLTLRVTFNTPEGRQMAATHRLGN